MRALLKSLLSLRKSPLTILHGLGKAEAVAKEINETGGRATAIPGDMLDAKYIDELVEKSAEFGQGKVHIIVNNAGFTWDGVIHKVCASSDSPNLNSLDWKHTGVWVEVSVPMDASLMTWGLNSCTPLGLRENWSRAPARHSGWHGRMWADILFCR